MSGKKRVLVVDDDRGFVASVKEWLEANGLDVMAAYDGAAGFEMAIKERPDLMILDVMMSTDTEGIEVSRRVAEHPELKHMPVLLLTGIRKAKNLPYPLEPDESWLPVRVSLEKPVPPDQLLHEVRHLLGI